MPYISGTQYDFENRLHCFPTGTSDLLTGYLTEGNSYSNLVSGDIKTRWNKEYTHQYLSFSGVISTGNFS